MLVTPAFCKARNPIRDAIAAMGGRASAEPRQIIKGVYEINHFSGDHELDRFAGWGSYESSYPVLGEVREFKSAGVEPVKYGSFNPYGVCDSYEQVLEQCPEIIESSRQFCLFVTRLDKKNQSPKGGWRWHKWGPYIGKQEPECEYLYDEPVVETVYVYHVYERV